MGFGRLQQLLELKDYVPPSTKCNASSPHSVLISNATLAWEMDEEKPAGKAKKKGELNSLEKVKKSDMETTEEGNFLNTLFDVNLTVPR